MESKILHKKTKMKYLMIITTKVVTMMIIKLMIILMIIITMTLIKIKINTVKIIKMKIITTMIISIKMKMITNVDSSIVYRNCIFKNVAHFKFCASNYVHKCRIYQFNKLKFHFALFVMKYS